MICPAKINLGLKVHFKRPDNYHEIESIFLKLNWGDEIDFSKNQSGEIRLISKNELLPAKQHLFEEVSERGDFTKNILHKTFLKAKEIIIDLPGVDVHLTKRIPPGGGLGGGSTNAASLLIHLFKTNPEHETSLREIAPLIGADIPFFLSKGHAHVSGIGEVLTGIEIASGLGILAIPPVSINTKDSYLSLKKPLQREWGQKSWSLLERDFLIALKSGDWSILREKFENDFEKYAFSVYPELSALKQDLYKQGSSFVSMTGTGSCLYGFVEDLAQGEKILKWMTQKYPNHYFLQFSF
ncbi:MAG: 4-(cytidine 5'-diphospho)-2-C-methyl-D-erythritol kinase [Leptospiraceae bacterium]|nr:4-(cytidine 5'-diphospho)-2-C-methyl-D-erythritol kinase [Leptospiraceae bacterium]